MTQSKSIARSICWLLLPGALVATVTAGCKREDEPAAHPSLGLAPLPPPEPEPPAAQPQPQPGATTGTTAGTAAAADPDLLLITIVAVDIDTKLAEMCKLAGSSVFFKFDSAGLSPEAKERLDQLAACAKTGPARGKELLVVGRADPTGSDEYNKKLGMSRADAVAKYLRDQGVPKARVETESKGEAAAPREPYAWPIERRVTVRLQQP